MTSLAKVRNYGVLCFLISIFGVYIKYMARDEKIKMQWEEIQKNISEKFGGGEKMDLDAIIYLIGIQELGKGYQKFSKDEKLNIMHISICKLLEPFGYYEFDYFDDDGWPHYKVLDELPTLKGGEQSVLMKEAVVLYFERLDASL